MQIVKQALAPEELALMRKLFDEEANEMPEQRAAALDRRLRERADRDAEQADRDRFAGNRAERRAAEKQARRMEKVHG